MGGELIKLHDHLLNVKYNILIKVIYNIAIIQVYDINVVTHGECV